MDKKRMNLQLRELQLGQELELIQVLKIHLAHQNLLLQ
jgi:hypothetical protein